MGYNMMLTLGALIMFVMFVNTSNTVMTGSKEIASQNEYYVAALGIAQSVLDEAKTKAFDEQTLTSPVNSPSSLTTRLALGSDGGAESVPSVDILLSTGFGSTTRFDDIDDYSRYKRRVNTPRAEGYMVHVTVEYASPTNPDSTSFAQTYCKKMNVKVTSNYIPHPVILSYAFTY